MEREYQSLVEAAEMGQARMATRLSTEGSFQQPGEPGLAVGQDSVPHSQDQTPGVELDDPFPPSSLPLEETIDTPHLSNGAHVMGGEEAGDYGDSGAPGMLALDFSVPLGSSGTPLYTRPGVSSLSMKRADTPSDGSSKRGRRSSSPSPPRPPTAGSSASRPNQHPARGSGQDVFIPLLRGVPQMPPVAPDASIGAPRKLPRRNTLSAIGEREQVRDGDSLTRYKRLLEMHERMLSKHFSEAIERIVQRLGEHNLSSSSLVKLPNKPQPYGNIARAAGLDFKTGTSIGPRQSKEEIVWAPTWQEQHIKVFRGRDWIYLSIKAEWHDPDLMRAILRTYNRLRTWRRFLSLKDISRIHIVHEDHTVVYPRRLDYQVVPAKNQRFRHFLHRPHELRDKRDFMIALTRARGFRYGIEYIEGWALWRIAVAVLIPVVLSFVVGVLYTLFSKDAGDAFTIAGYMTSAYSACLVMLGVLNFVEV